MEYGEVDRTGHWLCKDGRRRYRTRWFAHVSALMISGEYRYIRTTKYYPSKRKIEAEIIASKLLYGDAYLYDVQEEVYNPRKKNANQ